MITVHLILNAHIDPVWLWPWQAGLDEALATCRSACDRLDAHPDLIFTRGEAWVYREVERIDPDLFARIRVFVAAGRWEIVGGWWLQPDCNLPSRRGIERQMTLGRDYFESRFGPEAFPHIGYNVDSFGHAAALPGLMRAHGQDRYIFMRPQEHEKPLPARLFRWRGCDDGPEVVTFRIASAYTTRRLEQAHFESCLTALPPGITDTMCFVGVGDHGGGPTEAQIAWCRENADAFEGARLVFSSPSRFFAAIEPQMGDLPLFTGELQHHAIGCYSVHRPIKTAVQRAEQLLEQAETVVGAESVEASRLTEAWERVCFAQFHDTLGGTCLPSAYPQILDQVGGAAAGAGETLQYALRRRLRALPDDTRQRIVAFNPTDAPFSGCVEFEPWLDWRQWQSSWGLVDDTSTPVPYQTLDSEALRNMPRLLFRADISPGALRAFHIVPDAGEPAAPTRTVWDTTDASGDVSFSENRFFFRGVLFRPPELQLLTDETDTWSHGIDRYPEGPGVSPHWNASVVVDNGPLMVSRMRTGQIGDSTLTEESRIYAGEPFFEIRLTVHWRETRKALKFVFPLHDKTEMRLDGVMGGHIARANDGKELPIRDWTLLNAPDKNNGVGVVCPDVFAADATSERLRLTLLRAPYLAHHDPEVGAMHPRRQVSDQGVHTFRFRIFRGSNVGPEILENHARQLHRPPLFADLTRGMLPTE